MLAIYGMGVVGRHFLLVSFRPWQLSEANFHFWAGVISVAWEVKTFYVDFSSVNDYLGTPWSSIGMKTIKVGNG